MRRRILALGVALAVATPLVTAVPALAATGYYVAPTGSDTADGLTPQTAFQHIQRCATLAQPGDTCRIMTGTYHEKVVPARSGTDGAPITFTADTGANVVVDGADPVTGWAAVTGSDLDVLEQADPLLVGSPFATAVGAGQVYRAPLTVTIPTTGVQVFGGGTALTEAQWPAPGPDPLTPDARYAGPGSAGTSTASTVTIADPGLTQPAGYWAGARAYVGYWYSAQTTTATASASGSVSLTGPICLGIAPGQTRFRLFGTLKAFTGAGQWFYDGSQLFYWSPSGPPSGISAKQRTDAFDLSGTAHIGIRGLTLHAATIRSSATSNHLSIDRISASYLSAYSVIGTPNPSNGCQNLTYGTGGTGIMLFGDDSSLTNSTLAFSDGNGVSLAGHRNTLSDNVIHDVDAQGTYASGVIVSGTDHTVVRNSIHRVGRAAITVQSEGVSGSVRAPGHRIAYNDIAGYARLNVDTGGIYSCCALDLTGTDIDHNWVHDAAPMPVQAPHANAGIYLDRASSNGRVFDNVGWNNPNSAVFLCQGSTGVGVYNNDGGVRLGTGAFTGTQVVNNLDGVTFQSDYTAGSATIGVNQPGNPLYTDPSARDYTLSATSPALTNGALITGVTTGNGPDGDPVVPAGATTASQGAYQDGMPRWVAGAPSPPDLLDAVRLQLSATSLPVGQTATSTVTALTTLAHVLTPSSVTTTYRSTAPSVASVAADGTVTALAPGTTSVLVRVTSGPLAATASVPVVVT